MKMMEILDFVVLVGIAKHMMGGIVRWWWWR